MKQMMSVLTVILLPGVWALPIAPNSSTKDEWSTTVMSKAQEVNMETLARTQGVYTPDRDWDWLDMLLTVAFFVVCSEVISAHSGAGGRVSSVRCRTRTIRDAIVLFGLRRPARFWFRMLLLWIRRTVFLKRVLVR